MERYYIGIDIGGMTVKGLICDIKGVVYSEGSIQTGALDGGKTLCENIAALVDKLLADGKTDKSEICGAGIGCPGLIDSKNGEVLFAGNLGLKNFPLAEKIAEITGMPVKITNDANAAALGEAKFGAGKKYSDSIFITLGTGVGGGIIIDGKLFEGFNSAGAEIGHTVIELGGRRCTCGREGCLERYASASALMEDTRTALEENCDSKMWESYTPQTVTGRTAFEYMDEDITARRVVENYVKYLACGIANLANIFRPQVVMLGGGVSGQGERLTVPVQKLLDKEIFAGNNYSPVKVVKASLGSRAGAFGAAALIF